MKKFILISVLAMSALSCFSQSKAIKASYFCEMKIPDEVKDMKDENIRMLVIEQLKEKNLEYTMYFRDGTYGFSSLSDAIRGDNFVVGGELGVFLDMKKKERISQETIIDKEFIVKDTLSPLSWSIGSETKTILGKNCIKATALVGKTELTAWFCEEIPVQVGPAGYCGLPGLIMEAEDNNFVYTARNVEYTSSNLQFVPPSKGQILSREKFDRLQEKKLKEMGVDSKEKGGVQIIRL